MSTTSETITARRARTVDPSPDALRPRRPRPQPAKPALEVVRRPPRRSRRLRRRATVAGGLLAALGTIFGLVLVHVELTANELRLTTLQAQAEKARVDNLKLRLQVSQLESPERIVATAQQLGMVFPPSITYLTAMPGSGPVAAPGGHAGTGVAVSPAGVQGWAAIKRAATGP
jgi:cell division protein FtsL